MFSRKVLLLSGLCLALGAALAARSGPSAEDDTLKDDEKLLRGQDFGTDAAGLLAFLQIRTASTAGQQRMDDLIRQLGHRSFSKRSKAEKELLKYGPLARRRLHQALEHPDLEIADRARKCLAKIDNGPGPYLATAAVHLLARRKPAGAVEALLAYIPWVDDTAVEEEVLTALRTLGVRKHQPEASLVKAAADPQPARRAAAGFVLGRLKNPAHKAAVARLLKDKDPGVRYRTAQALFAAKDREGVAALINLLGDAPTELANRVEALLLHIAGEKVPSIARGGDSAAERKQWRGAWARWWKENGARIDLTRIAEQPSYLHLTVLPEMHANKVWECGSDGKERWRLTDLRTPIDAHALPTGRVLVAEMDGDRVTERDRKGKIHWQFAIKRPVACQRLPNGNTYIGTNHKVMVVTPGGKEVFAYSPEADFYIHSSHRMPNGHVVLLSMTGLVREVNAAGKVVRSFQMDRAGGRNWSGLVGLPGNRYLVTDCSKGEVFEVDTAGKTRWQFQMGAANYAIRLPNGNTLVASGKGAFEINRDGKTVWKRITDTSLWRVHQR
jgi:HEAT repeat protein